MLVCACLMMLLRLTTAFEIGIDQAVQLEAAERLIRGLGLTSTYFGSHPLDLAQPTTAEYLTWFPPAFSIVMGGFLAMGIPLLTSLKTLYFVTTVIGWLGWAMVANRLFAPYVGAGERLPSSVAIVAVMAPVFLTPSWSGTDVFLWAATPYVVLLLLRAVGRRSWWVTATAGLIVGWLCLFRYASAFLVPASLVILFQLTFPDLRKLALRAVIFGAAVLIGILPIVLHRPPIPSQGLVGFVESVGEVARRPAFEDVAEQELPAIGMGVIGSPLLQKGSEKFEVPWLSVAIGLMAVAAMLLLPCLAMLYPLPAGGRLSGNVAVSLAALQLCLSLFLLVLTATRPESSPSFLLQTRYFLPVSLASLLVWALLAGRPSHWSVLPGRAVMVLLVAYYCGYLPVASLIRRDTVEFSRAVLGTTPPRSHRYRSTSQPVPLFGNNLYSVRSTTRRKVADLHRQYPDAVFFIENYHYFVYGWGASGDPVPGTHMRRFLQPQLQVRHGDPVKVPGGIMPSGLAFWEAAYTSRPLRVIWVLNNREAIDFIPAQNRRWLYDDPFEGTTISMSEFPAGKLTPPGTVLTRITARGDAAEEGRLP